MLESLLGVPWWVILPVLFVVFFIALVMMAGVQAVAGIGKAYLEPMQEQDASAVVRMVLEAGCVDSGWLDQNDFAPLGVYHVVGLQGTPAQVVWAKSGERTYLNLYRLPNTRVNFDFVTMLDSGGLLTTGNDRDGQMLPPQEGTWVQSFTSSDAGDVWPRHVEGLAVLATDHNVQPARGEPDVDRDFVGFMKTQHAYVTSLPLWQLRVPYWYFVRRVTLHGKPVA